MSTVEEILQQNIHQAGLVAMRRAVQIFRETYVPPGGWF